MNLPDRLVIVGAGGHGRSVLELVRLLDAHNPLGFLDDALAQGTTIMGLPILGPTSMLEHLREHGTTTVHVAIGHNPMREALCARARAAGLGLTTLIHPRACVAPSAVLGDGSAVMALAVVGTEARLGEGVIVNVGAVVDHHASVGHHGHLGANATMAGGTSIGARAWLQAGSAIGYRVHLDDDVILPPGEGRA